MRVCTYNKKLEMIGAIIDESSVTNRGVGKHLASFVPHCTTSLYGSDVNIDIHNELLVAGKRYRSDSGQITSASQAQEEIKRIKECIRSQFESFQAKRRKLELSIEKQKEKERKARYGRRMAYVSQFYR